MTTRIPPIEEHAVQKNDVYQTVTERYFTPRFFLGTGARLGEDHCILFHSNRICIITLADRHPIRQQKKTISKIDFQVSTNVDRLNNKVSGKGKHGAQFLQSTSPLCFIECDDGTKYTIFSCIQGKLVEMNDALIGNPGLLVEKPDSEGYIAIVLPNIATSEKQKECLLTYEKYKEMSIARK